MNSEPQHPTPQSASLPHKEGLGGGTSRIEWIDALRGFTMVLVVAYHVCQHGYGESPKESLYLSTFVLFRMPLFFFISGFFSYSSKVVWNLPTLGANLWKKFRIQMLPTIIFFSLLIVTARRSFWDGCLEYLDNPTKGGYWFTYVLLLMFASYYLFAYAESFVSRWLKARSLGWLPITLFWLFWLGFYATWFMPSWFKYPKDPLMDWTSFGQLIQYFHFFLAGNIVRRYWPEFQRLFDRKWFVPMVLTIAVVCLCEFMRWHFLRRQWVNLPRTLCMYSMTTIVVLYFRHYAAAFTRETVLGRTLQYIGTRTLDIYLIHFLFIPHLHFVGPWLRTIPHNFTLDLTLSLLGASVVISVSLVVSNIIRISPVLRYYLFGRK